MSCRWCLFSDSHTHIFPCNHVSNCFTWNRLFTCTCIYADSCLVYCFETHFVHPGTIHHDLHWGNIICLEQNSPQTTGRVVPCSSQKEIFSQFGIIDFGDIMKSCCVFELTIFLHASTTCNKKTPPKEYVERMTKLALKMKHNTVDDASSDGGTAGDDHTPFQKNETVSMEFQTERGHASTEAPHVKEQGPSTTPTSSFEPLPQQNTQNNEQSHTNPSAALKVTSNSMDGLVLAGHAIAGYLTTSSLTELEWQVLPASVCARHIIILTFIRQALPTNMDDIENYISGEWNTKMVLKRLVSLGKDGVNAIWKDVCQRYGIVF